jgi:hypothetical protein
MKTWHQYLHDLADPIRVLTKQQVLDHYFPNSQAKMCRTLRAHESAGLITLSTELFRGRHKVSGPIVVIKAGELAPSAEQIAYAGRQRWSENAPAVIIRGTAKLAMLLGGKVHTVVAANLSHEVALTDLFLHKRKTAGPEFHWSLVNPKPGTGPVADAVTASGSIELIGCGYNGSTVSAKLTLAGSTNLELW